MIKTRKVSEGGGGDRKKNLSPSKCESREEAKENREEQDVIETGRRFHRMQQEGREEDRWE